MSETVYISGPMTGFPDHNRALFNQAATALRGAGWKVLSPVEFEGEDDAWYDNATGWEVDDVTYENLLSRDVDQVAIADVIAFLPGWSKSGGAGREGKHAIELGKRLYLWTPDAPGTLIRMPKWLFERYHTTTRLAPEPVS